ncbi:uncharacterized protein [Coffea arabica]|uniref:X8 domain-containing protein n=1 Tax=Coffea arabica TaxID=13443 RepID=A0A6P6WIA9_COFAR|nr:mucin-5AC-like [Coffea arabica]
MVQHKLKFHFELFPTEETPLITMASSRGSQYLFLLLLSLVVSASCASEEKFEWEKLRVFHPSWRELLGSFHIKVVKHDLVNPPVTTNPTTPVTNPVTTPSIVPPDNSAPAVVTVPATNPVGVTPNPVATPATVPPTNPVPVPNTNPVTPTVPNTNPVTPMVPNTNPVTPTVPATNPVPTPVTNPVTTPTTPGAIPVTSPVNNPTPAPVTPNAPATPGQSWCVAKSGTSETALQTALDYACGMGGADCSTIQQGGSCYNPNTVQNHASVAFNSYYQKNPSQTSCDFGGTAMITNANPSTGSCVLATSSSSSSPSTSAPTTASTSGGAPTAAGSGASPTVLNASNPTSGGTSSGFGDSPSTSSTSTSLSIRLQPAVGCILLVITSTFTRITVS